MTDSKSMYKLAKQLQEAVEQLESEAKKQAAVEAAESLSAFGDILSFFQTDFTWLLTLRRLRAVPTTDEAHKFVEFMCSNPCPLEVWKMVREIVGDDFFITDCRTSFYFLTCNISDVVAKLPNLKIAATTASCEVIFNVVAKLPNLKIEATTASYEAIEGDLFQQEQALCEKQQALCEKQQALVAHRNALKHVKLID